VWWKISLGANVPEQPKELLGTITARLNVKVPDIS
jgi:hypothetical protein